MKHSRLPNLQEEFSLPFPAPENRGVAAEYPDANGAQPLVSSADAKPFNEGNASANEEPSNVSDAKCVQVEDETKRVSKSPNATAYTTNDTNRDVGGEASGEDDEPQDDVPYDVEEEGLRDEDDNDQSNMGIVDTDEHNDELPNMGMMHLGEMAALTQNVGIFSCALVSLLRRPIAFNENLDSRVDVVLVDGPIHMKYSNWTSNRRYTPAPFLVSVPKSFKPVFGCGRFRDYDDFNRRAESNPAVALVRDFCHVTKDKFDLAQRNKGTIVQLAFDLVAYEKAVGKTDFANESMKTLAAQRRKDISSRNVALGTITGGRK